MPAAIDEIVKRRVIQEWFSGCPRDKIALENNIGSGTVTSIVSNYKIGLENLDLDSIRNLAAEAKKQGLSLHELAAHFRLYNFFRESGVSEDEIESFVAKVHSSNLPPEQVVQYMNQFYDVSKEESIPPDQVSSYVMQKFEEKRKLEDEIKEADAILQSKNVSIEAINQHIQLNEELNKHGLSTNDIHRLLNLLLTAKEYRFSAGKIVGKLRNIERLENKEKRLKNNCEILSKQIAKHKETLPLAELIRDMHIGKSELISFKVEVNEAAELYGFPPSTAAFHVLNNLRDYNRIGALKKELSALYLQKFAINEFCSRHRGAIAALVKLQSYGVTEDHIIILSINSILERNNNDKTNSLGVAADLTFDKK
jgi:hypothetical protein